MRSSSPLYILVRFHIQEFEATLFELAGRQEAPVEERVSEPTTPTGSTRGETPETINNPART